MWGLFLIGFASAGLIGAGCRIKGKPLKNAKKILTGSMAFAFGTLLVGLLLSLVGHPAFAATAGAAAVSSGAGMGFIGAGLSTGIACLGAGIGVGGAGAAALGLVGEKPEMLGTTLIYLGLAEGIAIYGVIISLLIMGRL